MSYRALSRIYLGKQASVQVRGVSWVLGGYGSLPWEPKIFPGLNACRVSPGVSRSAISATNGPPVTLTCRHARSLFSTWPGPSSTTW